MKSFSQAVYDVVSTIPKGKVVTYTQVAKRVGKPKAARAVGNALNKNRNFDAVPCHRVVRADGSMGGYVYGIQKKIALLKKEGVEIEQGRVNPFHIIDT